MSSLGIFKSGKAAAPFAQILVTSVTYKLLVPLHKSPKHRCSQCPRGASSSYALNSDNDIQS